MKLITKQIIKKQNVKSTARKRLLLLTASFFIIVSFFLLLHKKPQAQNLPGRKPLSSNNWGISNTHAPKAWKAVTKGSHKTIVAIIDTGIDTRHKALKTNLWKNKGEMGRDAWGRNKATNGIDDDKNGFIDDVHGWNFVGNNSNLKDHHGHGTHIAGIIGANGKGASGISPQVSLMILKYYNPNDKKGDNLKNTIRAIYYAVRMGAGIINYSGGGLEPSAAEKKALKFAQDRGVLVVAAAGNESSNSDIYNYYPANYNLKNIVSVTAIEKKKNKVLSSSNYGKHSVDIAAPGHKIYSTLPGGRYGSMTGTSQATAFVSGVAALIKSRFPSFKASDMKKYLTQTGDEVNSQLLKKTKFGNKINAYKALTILDKNISANGVVVKNTSNLKPFTFKTQRQITKQKTSLTFLTKQIGQPSVLFGEPLN